MIHFRLQTGARGVTQRLLLLERLRKQPAQIRQVKTGFPKTQDVSLKESRAL